MSAATAEREQFRHLAQSAGCLPPYTDILKVERAAQRMPEYWPSGQGARPRHGLWFESTRPFWDSSDISPNHIHFFSWRWWKWAALMHSRYIAFPDSPNLPRTNLELVVYFFINQRPDNYNGPAAPGRDGIQLYPDHVNERLRAAMQPDLDDFLA